MSVIEVYLRQMQFNRSRTLATLDEISKMEHPQLVLGWRPGTGRAHIAWHLAHVAITEELFATERLFNRPAGFPTLISRYKGGSVPDDQIPSVSELRQWLDETRLHLVNALGTFSDSDLPIVPEPLKERGWSLETTLQVLCWHEAHHQGQAHAVLNLYKHRA
ncbi:MAG: hypothetical protein KatS3mg113_0870 [Planctomycetaceae bacterium]|nr:MAG: hypothetical protein KatS3mg113_0870 [Planctomycetaceae bacterium]